MERLVNCKDVNSNSSIVSGRHLASLDPDHDSAAAGGISSQLVPEFSRKLSIADDNEESVEKKRDSIFVSQLSENAAPPTLGQHFKTACKTAPSSPHTSQSAPSAPHTNQTAPSAPHTSQTAPSAPHTSQTAPSAPHTSQTAPSAPHTNQTAPSAPHTSQTAPSAPHTNQTAPSAPHTNQTAPSAPHTNQTAPSAPHTNQTAPSAPLSSQSAPSAPHTSQTAPSAPHTNQTAPRAGDNKQPFVCVCGESFDKSVQLAAHKRWSCALKEKTSQCDVCKNWFASDLGLKRHMKHAHGGDDSCDSCNLRFPNRIKLTRHWMEAHYNEGGENSLKCFQCGHTSFDSKLELECHLALHKFEKHQEKLAQSAASMSHPFSPYHSPPFLRAMRPPLHPFHHPYGFGPQWSPFPFRPVSPLFPFMPHVPFRPPFPPSPRLCHFSAALRPFSSREEGHSTVQSSTTSTVYEPSSRVADETSTTSAATDLSDHNPHHNHEYVEPTTFPWFFHQPYGFRQQHRSHRHRHLDHHGKKKWKKYLKLMMKGKVPSLLTEPAPSQDVAPSQGQAIHVDRDASVCEFKMACKFCEKVIEKNEVLCHQRKECPVLAAHRCSVCDRLFKKRHFLMRHMHEHKHYSSGGPGLSQVDQNSASLQENMNASLKLLSVSEDVLAAGRQLADRQTESVFNRSLGQCGVDKDFCDTQIDKENRMIDSSVIEVSHTASIRDKLRCATCKHACGSIESLLEHLKEHISQVLAVQKVREWTNKSSEYFFLRQPDDDDEDLEESGSFSTATTSYIDSEITSTASSAMQEHSSTFSSLETAASKDSKWIKPHKKRSRHRHKGEMNICDFCGEKFAFRKELHYHMEANHKDSTLECPVCQKKFSWKKRGKFYERHLNSHYGVKIFKHKCTVCGKTFLENSKLRAHMSLHNSELLHKCAVCEKGYANKSSLVRHERKHTGVKPYQCDVCSDSFMEKRELLRHSTTHTGLSPFSCAVCGQGFTLKTSLMSHMKKRHSKKDKDLHI